MKALHLHTEHVSGSDEAALVEMSLRYADGIVDVAAIHELGLLSVLYDERSTNPGRILGTIRSLGFDARRYEPSRFAHAS